MKISNMAMAVILIIAITDLIADIPTENVLSFMTILEFIGGLWFFLEFVPRVLEKMRDSQFRDFVYSVTITVGIMLCIGWSQPDFMEDQLAITALFGGLMILFLVLRRVVKVHFVKKNGVEVESKD